MRPFHGAGLYQSMLVNIRSCDRRKHNRTVSHLCDLLAVEARKPMFRPQNGMAMNGEL